MSQYLDNQQGGAGTGDKTSWIRDILVIIVIVAAVALIFNVRRENTGLEISSDNERLIISCSDVEESIAYEDMADVQLLEEFDIGTSVTGTENQNYISGQYENEEFGTYSLFISKKTEEYIAIRKTDGSYVVINCTKESDTEALYDGLVTLLNDV